MSLSNHIFIYPVNNIVALITVCEQDPIQVIGWLFVPFPFFQEVSHRSLELDIFERDISTVTSRLTAAGKKHCRPNITTQANPAQVILIPIQLPLS